jgi:hypothetical protein
VRCLDPEVTAQLGRFLSLDQVSEQQLALLARTLLRDEPIVDALASGQDGQHTLLVITTVRILAISNDGTHSHSRDVYLQDVASTSVTLPEQAGDGHYRILVSGRQATAWLDGRFTPAPGADGRFAVRFQDFVQHLQARSAPFRLPGGMSGLGVRGSAVDELVRLGALRRSGAITEEEYQLARAALLPASPMTPRRWCRRVLGALGQWDIQSAETATLVRLLTYFIELDPTDAAFDDLLAQHVDDPRPDVAAVASRLQHAWLLWRESKAEPAPPLQETLRTLGAFVDLAGARGAYLSVGPSEVAVQPFGAASTLHLGPLELMAESAARVALRGQGTPTDAAALPHHATLLRRLGGVLDAEEPQAYEVVVLPQLIVVEGEAGYYRVFAPEELLAPAPPDSDPIDG